MVSGQTDGGLRARLRSGFLTGVAVLVPILITGIVLLVAFDFVYQYVDRLSDAVVSILPAVGLSGVGLVSRELVVELAAPLVLAGIMLGVGLLVDSTRYGEFAVDVFDQF